VPGGTIFGKNASASPLLEQRYRPVAPHRMDDCEVEAIVNPALGATQHQCRKSGIQQAKSAASRSPASASASQQLIERIELHELQPRWAKISARGTFLKARAIIRGSGVRNGTLTENLALLIKQHKVDAQVSAPNRNDFLADCLPASDSPFLDLGPKPEHVQRMLSPRATGPLPKR